MSSILQVALLESPRVWNVSQPEYPSRRVPERKTGATCPNLGKCLLNPSAVKHCPGCRLQKCLRWGGTKQLTFEEVSIHLVLITSVGMDLGQVLNEDQRKERFSHSLQQKRAHKQMSGEADGASTSTLNTKMVTSHAKAPKLETRTLLQKFLDGRKPENQPKFGVDSPASEAQSPSTRSLTDNQESRRKEEHRMKVRTDLLAQEMLPMCHHSRNSQDRTKKDSTWSPSSISIHQGPNGFFPYPPFVRHHSVIQPPQTWPSLFWGFPPYWGNRRSSFPNLFFQNFTPGPGPPYEELSRSEPDTTTPNEKLGETSIQKVCDTDQLQLKLFEEKDKKMVMDYIHKKFRRTESSCTYQPPPRPSVIVSPQIFKEEKKITDADEDFEDILMTFSEDSDFSEFCNVDVSDVSEEELLDITSICELYFLEESTSSHLAETQKDFFAEWTQMPLGEDLMVTYINFCRGNIQTIGLSWFTNANANSR